MQPCRLCPHVVGVAGLKRFNDVWGYAVKPLMPDRSKLRFQTKRDTGVYAVRGRSRIASGCLLIGRDCANKPVTA